MVERNEARQQTEIAQEQLTASEKKQAKTMEARLAAKEQDLVTLRAVSTHPASRAVVQADAPPWRALSAGATREIVSFGALTNSVNSIIAGPAVTLAPRLPLALFPAGAFCCCWPRLIGVDHV